MIGLALIALQSTVTAPVAAQQNPPVQRAGMAGPRPDLASSADAVRTMQRFAACVVQKVSTTKLDAYLRLPPDSAASNKAMAKISNDLCAPNRPGGGYEMRFQPNVMRAGLYDSLYRLRYRSGPTDVSRVPKLDFAGEFDAGAEPLGGASLYFRSIGDCIARAHPRLAHDLLMTRQGAKEEGAALKAITPSFAPCVPQGSKLRFSAPMLRGMIAEALYKLSMAARNSPPVLAEKVDAK